MKNISQKIVDLQSSTLFYLSLGSKELFHSNFLAWISHKYPKQIGALFTPYLTDNTGDTSILDAKRELKNVDVYLYFANGQELIIENKVRSLPYVEQLEKYAKENPSAQNRLLLTLARPHFAQGQQAQLPESLWHVLTYTEYAQKLKKLVTKIHDPYDSSILSDYISFITNLDALFQNAIVNDTDHFTFWSQEADPVLKNLGDMRMSDVYLKLKYQQLALKVHESLKQSFPNHPVLFMDNGTRVPGSIHVRHGMMNTQGLMEAFYVIKKGLYLNVQLQQRSYRLMTQGYDGYGTATKKYAEELLTKGLWFTFAHIYEHPTIYPTRQGRVFNKYGKTDFYKYVKLTTEHTVEQIVQLFVEDLKHAVAIASKI